MRKITLFSAALLTATSVFAVSPEGVSSAVRPVRAVKATEAKASAVVTSRADNEFVRSRASEATPSAYATYTTVGAFFLGMTQDNRSYGGRFAFAPCSGYMGFASAVKADAYNWTYNEYVGLNQTEERTATTQNLIVDCAPQKQFEGPTLAATVNGVTTEYNDSVVEYFCGGNPYFWDFYGGDDIDDPEISGLVGVTPCVFDGEDWSRTSEGAIKRDVSTGYNSHGVSTSWTEDYFTDEVEGEDGEPVLVPMYDDLAITGFSYVLDGAMMPYQLSGMYVWVSATTTAETPINVNVYGFDENGKIDREKLLGKGTAILPSGSFSGMLLVELNAVNELGLSTTSPIIVDGQGAYIAMTGMDAESVTSFQIVYNFNLSAPVDNFRDAIYANIYPQNSYIEFAATKDDETKTLIVGNPWVYGNGPVYFARQYAIYFLIDFPMVMNAEDGSGEFNINIPSAGGSESVIVTSTEDIEQLYQDMEIDAVASADWFTFDVTYQENENGAGFTVVTAEAEALPAGVNGRTGEIKFTGYACDFTVSVTQGEAGISAVVANGNGVSEYYDLQGRRLTAAPAKGLYIERNGTTAATKLAR